MSETYRVRNLEDQLAVVLQEVKLLKIRVDGRVVAIDNTTFSYWRIFCHGGRVIFMIGVLEK